MKISINFKYVDKNALTMSSDQIHVKHVISILKQAL